MDKNVCLYIAQYLVCWTALKVLYTFPPLADLFIATPTRLLWEAHQHSSCAAITCEDYSRTFPLLSIATYSFIQQSELGCQWRERKCPNFETVAMGIRSRVLSIASPAFYHRANTLHCAWGAGGQCWEKNTLALQDSPEESNNLVFPVVSNNVSMPWLNSWYICMSCENQSIWGW